MKHVVQMFWNVDDKWNMTQPAEFLAFGAKCCGKKVWIAKNFCVWWEGGVEMTELDGVMGFI